MTSKTRLEKEKKQIKVAKGYIKAREDVNLFSSLVMRDQQTGKAFMQAEHHILIQNHITQCYQEGRFAGILAPWGFG